MSERHLAAILCADVVGYSRLMRWDEDGTIERLKALHRELIEPSIAGHKGRIVKTTGDGILAVFPSVVEAVACAVEVQAAVARRNAGLSPEQRLDLRIGVHAGDIIAEPNGDVLGDGVNVAARLQTLAEPGEVLVSRPVRDQVRDRLPFGFDDLGEKELKNIARPVRIFRGVFDPDAVPPPVPQTSQPATHWRRRRLVIIAAGALTLLLSAGLVSWWQAGQSGLETASPERMAFPLPEKPSIAVLPFADLSGAPTQDVTAAGLTESLVNALARNSFLFVIAHTSTATYAGQSPSPRRAAEELGVRYILEGSVLRAGDQVRVTTQLVDTLKGSVLWSERYERATDDLLALDEEITTRIARSLDIRIIYGSEQAPGGTRRLAAWDAYVKGRGEYLKFTRAGNARARDHFRRALEVDPTYAEAMVALANTYFIDMVDQRAEDRESALSTVAELDRQAARIDPRMPRLLELRSMLALTRGDHARALAEAEAMVELDPNGAESHYVLGRLYFFTGQYKRAINSLKTAERINPHSRPSYSAYLAYSYLALGRLDAAVLLLEAIVERWPDYAPGRGNLAIAYQLAGRNGDAREQVLRVRGVDPKVTKHALEARFSPMQDRPLADRFIEAAQQAGIFE